MADPFALLRRDHESVRRLLDALEAGEGRGPLIDRLVIEESRHEAAEEMYLWPAVRTRAPGGAALATEAILQERAAKRILEDLRKAAPEMPGFSSLAEAFSGAARRHMAFEEDEAWPALEQVLGTDDRLEMGGRLALARKAGPTRPHPHGPDSPGGLKTIGAAAAMMDKVADTLMRRKP